MNQFKLGDEVCKDNGRRGVIRAIFRNSASIEGDEAEDEPEAPAPCFESLSAACLAAVTCAWVGAV